MGKFVCFAILLLISQKTFGFDINELRENALRHVEENMDYLRKIINLTLSEIPLKRENLQGIINHEKSVGDAIVESSYVDVYKAQITGNMAVVLLNSYPFVLQCIREAKRLCISDVDSYHVDKFLKPMADCKAEAEKIQDDDIRKWTEEYNNAIFKFNEQYEATVRDIIKSNEEAEIGWLVKQFDTLCRDFNTVITNVNVYLSQTQYEVLVIMEMLADSLRTYVRTGFDTAQTKMRDCFNQYNVPNPRIYNFTIPSSIKNDHIL